MENTSHNNEQNSFWNRTCYKKTMFWMLLVNIILTLGLIGCMMHMHRGMNVVSGRSMMTPMRGDSREAMMKGKMMNGNRAMMATGQAMMSGANK